MTREISKDTLFEGRLICRQYKKGYRFSIDSVLVGHFALIKTKEIILDLGTGCGIIGLILLYRHQNQQITVTGFEKQANLACLAGLNVKDNNYSKYFKIVTGDVAEIKQHFKAESFSLVIANPPFYSSGSGRTSIDTEELAAKHQSDFGINGFIDGAVYCVRNRGRVVLVYPAELLSELLQALKSRKIEPKKLQFIYSYPDNSAKAKLVLVEGVKNGGVGLSVFPPCYIYKYKNGPYSEEVQAMYT